MSLRTLSWLVLFSLVAALALRMQNLIATPETDSLYREQAAYQQLRNTIRDRYVTSVDDGLTKKMFYGSMRGMVSSLDQHSQFFSPDEYEPFKTRTTGQLEGVGIEIDYSDTHGLVVLTPLQGTPAWEGGVLPGDRILKIDDLSTKDMKLEEARNHIQGPPGTKVALTILHEGQEQPVTVALTRAVIDIKSVPVAELLGPEWVPANRPKIGYVQLAAFQQKTAADFDAALKELEQKNMQALILDLRQNPGGLLTAAKEVAELFLKDGPIVKVIGRERDEQIYESKGDKTHPDYPLVVLIDSSSASASEIVSGALKDRGRATLVGDRSYGKFSVQEVIPMQLGKWGEAAMKLTTAKYKTPQGACIDGHGIEPDYLVPSNLDQQRGLILDRFQRHLRDNNPQAEKPVKNVHDLFPPVEGDNEKAKTYEPFVDHQLQKAVEVLTTKLRGEKTAP